MYLNPQRYVSPYLHLFRRNQRTLAFVESVLALPPHGIQLEVRRGLPRTFISSACCLFTTRRFIPLSSVLDVVINEGIRGWDIRYYLAILRNAEDNEANVKIEVAFEVRLFQCL